MTADEGCIKSTLSGDFFRLQAGSSSEDWLSQDPAWAKCTLDEEANVIRLDPCP